MSYRIAVDPFPEDPNPHVWALEAVSFATEEEATHFAESEEADLRNEYGDEYAADNFRWLVVHDKNAQ